jgi:hypothetical protein
MQGQRLDEGPEGLIVDFVGGYVQVFQPLQVPGQAGQLLCGLAIDPQRVVLHVEVAQG